jgi:hypothetical protein
MKVFEHTAREPGMWRGWMRDDQVLELHWGKRGWSFGAGVLIHSGDDDRGRRMLCLTFWRFSAYIPLGVTKHPISIDSEPQWSVFGSDEHGLWFRWGHQSKRFDWPGSRYCVHYQQQLSDGAWVSVFNHSTPAYSEDYPYTYTLKNGEVQRRTATISKRRHVMARRGLRLLGWPTWTKESIDIRFDGGVGERSGSWKGGTIGCSYDLRPGETMADALRRMERERIFR